MERIEDAARRPLTAIQQSLSRIDAAQLSEFIAAAMAAFEEQRSWLKEPAFENVLDVVTRPQVPPPSWFAQAQRNAQARQQFLEEFGALTSEEVASLAGSQATNRRAMAHRWQTDKRIFSVVHHGQVVYPGFQFDAVAGRPKPAVAEVLAALPRAMNGWALALWWSTPSDLLDWARPVDLIDETPGKVVRAATAETEDWAEANPTVVSSAPDRSL